MGGLPETMKLAVLEPLRELFKDKVRKLSVALGPPHEMVYRHPFPGPGLCVGILGEVKHEYAELLRRADVIFIEGLRNTPYEAVVVPGFDQDCIPRSCTKPRLRPLPSSFPSNRSA